MLTIRWAMLSRALRRSCLLLTLAAATAQAQPAAEPKPAEPAPEAPLEPKLPEIDDPMLKPVPSAKNVLRSWQEALRLARSQSSELALSAAQMDLADGQERQALSRALPTLTGTVSVCSTLPYSAGRLLLV